MPRLPRRIVIVGGGYIAVEFAGIFTGSAPRSSKSSGARNCSAALTTMCALPWRRRCAGAASKFQPHPGRPHREGAARRLHRHHHRRREDRNRSRHVSRPDASRTRAGSGSREIGVELTDNGAVKVDEWQRSTTVPNIYAVGDVTDRLNLTPVAIAEGRAIAETLYNNNPMRMDHRRRAARRCSASRRSARSA